MLTIPDKGLAMVNGHEQQAAPDTTDIQALVGAISGTTGVLSGFDATYHGTMQITLAAGSVNINGTLVNYAGGSVTIGSNTSAYERTDIICLKSDGTLDLIQGLPANPPIPPGIPAGECYLYRVEVSPAVTQIMPSDVTDKRAVVNTIAVGSGGPPSGTAGGDLAGSTYPNPVLKAGAVDGTKLASGIVQNAHIASGAAIDQAKIAGLSSALSGKQDRTEKGANNGYASLDTGGQVPLSQLGNAPGGGAPTGAAGGDLAGSTYPAPVVAPGAITPAKTTGIDATLTPTAIKTTAYTAVANDLVPVDVTAGDVTITLPTTPADKSRVSITLALPASPTHIVTIAAAPGDVFDTAGGPTSVTLLTAQQTSIFQYDSTNRIWRRTSNFLSLTALDARYTAGAARLVRRTITGDGTTTQFTVTHSLALSSPYTCGVTVIDPSATDPVDTEVRPTMGMWTTNGFTLTFQIAPPNGKVYNVVVIG